MSTFDPFSANYTQVIDHALSVTGGDRSVYAALRVAELKKAVAQNGSRTIKRILDFGCGDGSTSVLLSSMFDADVVGVDTSRESLKVAQDKFGSDRVVFIQENELQRLGLFDMVYCNGVFHHIQPAERSSVIKKIAVALTNDGFFALFENTPWNPGTRFVMSRIPFDADAVLVAPWNIRRDIEKHGLKISSTRYLFLIPPFLKPIFFLDEYFRWLPAGAQYLVLAKKTS